MRRPTRFKGRDVRLEYPDIACNGVELCNVYGIRVRNARGNAVDDVVSQVDRRAIYGRGRAGEGTLAAETLVKRRFRLQDLACRPGWPNPRLPTLLFVMSDMLGSVGR